LKVGDKLSWFEQLEREGRHIPLMDTRPELYPDLTKYFEAFNAVSSSRSTTFSGPGYIPISEIRQYLDEMQIFDFEERQEYIQWIQVLDNEYVGFQHRKIKKKQSKGKK